jgi:hypothetical protein
MENRRGKRNAANAALFEVVVCHRAAAAGSAGQGTEWFFGILMPAMGGNLPVPPKNVFGQLL